MSSIKYKKTIETFNNNGEKLFGILHHMDDQTVNNVPMVIFLHGFAGYRLGPHHLFVKTANALAKRGYSCLRFDFRGRGYSDGGKEDTNYKSMLSDLDIVIQSVKEKYSPSDIVLLGICSGARTALYYIKNGRHTINSLIELSSPYLWTSNQISTASSRTKSIISGYVQKAKNLDNWKRLVKGELNLPMIKKILHNSIFGYWIAIKESIPSKKKKIVKQQKKGQQPFLNFKGEVLLIHGEKDPETTVAMKQIHFLFKKHNINYQDLLIKNANHSFYSLNWEKEIIDKICDWLRKRFPLDI